MKEETTAAAEKTQPEREQEGKREPQEVDVEGHELLGTDEEEDKDEGVVNKEEEEELKHAALEQEMQQQQEKHEGGQQWAQQQRQRPRACMSCRDSKTRYDGRNECVCVAKGLDLWQARQVGRSTHTVGRLPDT